MIVIALGLSAAVLALAAALTDSIGLAVAAAGVTVLGMAFWGLDLTTARRQRLPVQGNASELADSVQTAVGSGAASGVVYVIPGRTRFHRAGCSSIADRDVDELSRPKAEEDGLLPCGRCSPPV